MGAKKTIEDVISKAGEYLKNPKSIQQIRDAFELARKHHEGQFRKSMDPYIQHPLEVAYMLAELRSSPTTIVAGLLHDVLEDTDLSKEELSKQFGEDVASIVDGVTKIGQLKYMTKEKALARAHQKILLAMARDIRVVLVKLVDRVHNMRTLEYQTPDKQLRIAKETMDLYSPLAHRLGMYKIKAELEDLSLKYLAPEEYNHIKTQIEATAVARDEDIHQMEGHLEDLLEANKIENFEIKGRVKNIFSICKKMRNKNLEFHQVYDLMALRILVPTVEECYHVLGLVHSQWTPLPKRFKDYIAIPKPNLYQSLHTTIVGLNGKIYEIQIRTYEMDEIAEYGIAAHWAYKEDISYSPEKEQREIGAKLRWYRELLSYVEMNDSEDVDPLDNIRTDIFSANVYVFTPKGDVLDFPADSTPLDFAYRIHTEVGNQTIGAIVNGKMVPLTYKLKTGDVVEIKTSKNANGPNEDWLRIVKTSHARHKITSVLNKRRRDTLIEKGKEEFERVLKNENLTLKLDDKTIAGNFEKYGITALDDFYFEIGKGSLSAKAAANRLSGKTEKFDEEALLRHYSPEEEAKRKKRISNEYAVSVEGLERAQVRLASCCYPVYGDEIVGYVTKGRGIVVHRLECNNVKSSSEERFINVFWDEEGAKKPFETYISILSFDRKNIVAEMINMLNSYPITITSISSGKNKNGDLLTKVKMTVGNLEVLNNSITSLYKISDIFSVERKIR
ncbi:MAG: bifunctional (p)ppGpp synthetase/guanosine-3',5'-bis(diphosphate) 3'-pyrophosphohydrolase [Acholeplasmataceae bacterium]|jgi:guanosine-3',5'-bis(diphosphate) 3'-pyrophosphohydrolase|nr:bifunctional (p)ppGpp synthetase/guanosine-3',5'-bis(diphosphate) 3'-pyrophosphohydrolase [Acholeplasmataceae bacterium]